MDASIVFALTGPDRIGIVDEVTKLLLDLGGNVETSRMTRLGGEFAMLMLFSMPADRLAGLDREVAALTARGYQVTTRPTRLGYAESPAAWLPYRIEVLGADHEGIIHQIAHAISQYGINIESMDTGTVRAPNSGAPLFTMNALVAAPPGLPGQDWKGQLKDVGHHLNVEIKVAAAAKG